MEQSALVELEEWLHDLINGISAAVVEYNKSKE